MTTTDLPIIAALDARAGRTLTLLDAASAFVADLAAEAKQAENAAHPGHDRQRVFAAHAKVRGALSHLENVVRPMLVDARRHLGTIGYGDNEP